MIATTRTQNRYDHRLRDLVRSTGSIEHALRRGVPRSTARGWLSATRAEVVTLDVVERDVLALQNELLQMRRRVERLATLLRLIVVLLKVSGFSLARNRISEGTRKQALLQCIERSQLVLPLRVVLRVLKLSPSRYHAWKREAPCGLGDRPSCPRGLPQQLTEAEVETIRQMVTSEGH